MGEMQDKNETSRRLRFPWRAKREQVRLLRFPWPYQAMLAISTDIDGSRLPFFRELHRFINSRDETPHGPGVGLDIANSFWFYNDPFEKGCSTTYFSGQKVGVVSARADEMANYVRGGWVDTLHTYGNFSKGVFRREHALRAVAAARDEAMSFAVWSDHSGTGHRPNLLNQNHPQPEHLECVRELGVRYVCLNRQTFEMGQQSALQQVTLRDGSRMWGFDRTAGIEINTTPDGIIAGLPPEAARHLVARRKRSRAERWTLVLWQSPFLHLQCSQEALEALVERGGFAIVSQHLTYAPFAAILGQAFYDAFRRLANFQKAGKILVTRTSRLLEYNVARDYLDYTIRRDGERLLIDVAGIDDPVHGYRTANLEALRGIQFSVRAGQAVTLRMSGQPLAPSEMLQAEDGTGRAIVGFRWHPEMSADLSATWRADAAAAPVPQRSIDPLDKALRERDPGAKGQPRRPLAHYRDALESLGMLDGGSVLDVGAGAGRWSFAALASGGTVTAADPRLSEVDLGNELARKVGMAARLGFVHTTPYALGDLQRHFEHVLSHRFLQRFDLERALGSIRSVLKDGGLCYLALTGPGAQLKMALTALEAGDTGAAREPLEVLVNEGLLRCGTGAPLLRARGGAPLPEDLDTIAELAGFERHAAPNLADQEPGRHSCIATFDGLYQAVDGVHKSAWVHRGATANGYAHLQSLIGRGLVALAADAAADAELALSDAQIEAVRLQARFRIGKVDVSEAAAERCAEALGDRRAQGLLLARYWINQGAYSKACDALDIIEHSPLITYLAATANLLLGRSEFAIRGYQLLTRAHPGLLPAWAGLLAALSAGGDHSEQAATCGRCTASLEKEALMMVPPHWNDGGQTW
jgi:SAM-dependent methyltransferase